jgi:hypothetical protein
MHSFLVLLYSRVMLHIAVWQFAKRAQITSGSFAKGNWLNFACMQYQRFSCNVDHVLQHHLEN